MIRDPVAVAVFVLEDAVGAATVVLAQGRDLWMGKVYSVKISMARVLAGTCT